MAHLTLAEAEDLVEAKLTAHRRERADGLPPSQGSVEDFVEAVKRSILKDFSGQISHVVARSRLDAIAIAEQHGCSRDDLVRGSMLDYDGFGGATSAPAVGAVMVSHLIGEIDLGEHLVSMEAVLKAHAEIAGTITLVEDDASNSLVILVPMPTRERRDALERLHCQDGPAVSYCDEDLYYWHDLPVPQEVITKDKWSLEEIQGLETTEIRRALAERLGAERVVQMMGATEIDHWTDPITGLSYVLLDCVSAGKRYLSLQSPPLHDGSQPTYIESVSVLCMTVRGARKWRATLLSENECDDNPELSYACER